MWSVVSGTGRVVLDGEVKNVRPGDIVQMPKGSKHTVIADTELTIIEVQLGRDITVEDKIKYKLDI